MPRNQFFPPRSRASTVRNLRRRSSANSASVKNGVGEYVPMPPVFRPWSPSSARLWSCEVGKIFAVLPSQIACSEISMPSRNSWMTMFAPAAPKALPTRISSTAFSPRFHWRKSKRLCRARGRRLSRRICRRATRRIFLRQPHRKKFRRAPSGCRISP